MTRRQANPAGRDRADGEDRDATRVVTQGPRTTATDTERILGHHRPNDWSDFDSSDTGNKTGIDRIGLWLSHEGV